MKIQTLKDFTIENKITNEKLLGQREELVKIISDANAALGTVNSEFAGRIAIEGQNGRLSVGDKTVVEVSRPIFKDVTLATAARYEALKTVIDTSKLLPLLAKGRKIKGVTQSKYIAVK